MAKLTIDVPRTVVLVARVQTNADPALLPTYSTWRQLDGVRVLDLLCASSSVGHSTCKIALSTGEPGKQIDVEKGRALLGFGDRVAVGLDRGRWVDWQFCGYCVSDQLTIDASVERCIWKLVGPEYWWGDTSGASGAALVVRGQLRRNNVGDAAWRAVPTTVTPYDQWELFTDENSVLNPDGKRNMTTNDVVLALTPKRINGRIWEATDRRVNGAEAAAHWDMRNAAKMLVSQYGDLEFSGIVPPDWNHAPMTTADRLSEIDVGGVGCFEALRRVLGGKFGFFVDPRPMDAKGNRVDVKDKSWGPFQLVFFSRTDGPAGNFHLNQRGTPMSRAKASVTRLEVATDISKSPNVVRVQGSFVRSVKLVFWGGRTPALPENLKKTSLQQGWDTTFNLFSFARPGSLEIDPTFAGVTAAKRSEWYKKYHTAGVSYNVNWFAFRRFVWNEANELDTTKQTNYAGALTRFYAPDLFGVADTPDDPGKWYRRRRKPQDTLYLRNEQLNSYERHPPTLYMAVAPSPGSAEWNALKWRKISPQYFQLDEDRCGITIVADDIAEWRPFHKQDTEDDVEQSWPDDPRTFATLLLQGTLRMCLECSVAVDNAMVKVAKPTGDSGAPFPREIWVKAQTNFIHTLTYNDGLNPINELEQYHVDLSADAQRQADITRNAGQEENVHASILTAGDWERQKIGSQIQQVSGRKISLAKRSGRGAQIVAVRLDVQSFKYEYLTESLALGLKDRERELLERKAQVAKGAHRTGRISAGT
jgi:hypothetical protein